MMYFGGGWMIVIWVVIIGLIIWSVIALTRHYSSGMMSGPARTPLDMAKERYARGEITKEEFELLKKDLN